LELNTKSPLTADQEWSAQLEFATGICHQPRLADPGLTADQQGCASNAIDAGVQQGAELPKLGSTPNQRMSFGC
jgi:hypothetical protein